MRNIVPLILAMMALSCTEQVREVQEEEPVVAATKAEVPKLRADTIALFQRNVAYADFRFGMTPNEFYEAKTRNKDYFYKIGHYRYAIQGAFDDSEGLYQLRLEGMNTDPNKFDPSLRKEIEALCNVVSKTYGEASLKNTFPSWSALRSEETYWIHTWQVAEKTAAVGLSKTNSDMCFAVARFRNRPETLADTSSLLANDSTKVY